MAGSAEGAGLRVGFVPGVTLTRWRRAWGERLPRVPLAVVEVPEADQRRALDSGEVDLCLVRLPLATDGLHLIRLYDEVAVAWVAKDHPLALFDEVTLADLDGEDILRDPDAASVARVVAEEAVLLVPMSVARSHSRRDLAYRPVTDAPPTAVALAWRVDRENPWIDEFVGIVRGRTANSSRTARERTGQGTAAPDPTAPAPTGRRTGDEAGRRKAGGAAPRPGVRKDRRSRGRPR